MSFAYSTRNYSEGNYGGGNNPFLLNGVVASVVEVFAPDGTQKGFYQTGSGEFLGIEFVLDDSGCRDFTLFFADFAEINKKDIIRVRLFNSLSYFFTGVVRRVPIEGSTDTSYNYAGYGLNDYLLRANTESKTYASKTINYIIQDLLDTVVIAKTPINKNLTKIDSLTTVVDSIEFKYVSCIDAFQQLKKLAQSTGDLYIVGVDEVGDFFFKARSSEEKAAVVVGKEGRYGIEEYSPEDTIEEISKLFVLDKNGTYITSVSTSENNDIFEEKVTAPDIGNADIPNWAQGILTEREIPTRRATVDWSIWPEEPILLTGDGNMRVVSNIPPEVKEVPAGGEYGSGVYGSGIYGGAKYTGKDLNDILRIKEVAYTINSNTATMVIQLGGLPVRLEQQIIDVNKNIDNLRVSLGR